MIWQKLVSYFLSVCALFSAFFWYRAYRFLGFPDGHLTQLDRSLNMLYPIYILFNVLFAIYFCFFAYRSKRGLNFRKLSITILLFLFSLILIFALNAYLATILEHGTGG